MLCTARNRAQPVVNLAGTPKSGCTQEWEPQRPDQLLQAVAALIHEHGAGSDRDGAASEDASARTRS